MRPARLSSSITACTVRAGRPVVRTTASSGTGAGPRAADDGRMFVTGRESAGRSRQATVGRDGVAVRAPPCACAAAVSIGQLRRQRRDDIVRFGDQRRALLEQMIGAFRARIERVAWDANTSRPCSPAMRAVISVPERRAASTTTTPIDKPEMMRLRRGKSWPRGWNPGGISLTMHAALGDARLQRRVLGRIDEVDAAGDDGDGAGIEARLVCRRIDAARES